MAVVIETTLGDITVDLFLKERPKAALNFLKLCKLKFYNYNLFHTVEHGFIAQTGDPTGTRDGGKSVWGVIEGVHKRYFEAEFSPKIRHSEPGLLSMVGTGDNMIGSQFMFTLGPDLTSLDGKHCVIGEVTEGHSILRLINEALVDDTHRPYQDIRITHTVVLVDPFNDPRGFRQPSRSPSPTAERLQGGRIAADEEIDDTDGKTEEEVAEMLAEREAKARATILEIVGDIPDAEIAPPENVLFVCKLNPVTTDDDLQIIFSRFGKIKGCEVIRDKVSGDSLQYAFIEFELRKSCEDAYFKMDNVLIDDRRIHVDFSQSVSKIKWRGKGRGIEYLDGSDRKSFKEFYKSDRQRKRCASRLRKSTEFSRSRSPRSPRRRSNSRMRNRPYYSPEKSYRNNDRYRRDGGRYSRGRDFRGGRSQQNIRVARGSYDYKNRRYPDSFRGTDKQPSTSSATRRRSRSRSFDKKSARRSRSADNFAPGPRRTYERERNVDRRSRSFESRPSANRNRNSYSSEKRDYKPKRESRSPFRSSERYRPKSSSLDRIVARQKRSSRSLSYRKKSFSPEYKARPDDKYKRKPTYSRSPVPRKKSYSPERVKSKPPRMSNSPAPSAEKPRKKSYSIEQQEVKVKNNSKEAAVVDKQTKIKSSDKAKLKSKKKRNKSSGSSDSDASASSDSSSDEKTKRRKKKSKKKKSKKSKKYSSTDGSSNDSGSDSSAAANDKRKKSKKKK